MASSSDLLHALEIYPVATVRQLSVLLNTSEQVVRRWVRAERSVRTAASSIGRSGRPQQLVSLTGRSSSHDVLVTEHAVALVHKWGSAYSPVHPSVYSYPDWNGPIPDLGYVIQSRGKSHLFFLEVDCGTEPVVRDSPGSDLFGKVSAYLRLRATRHHRLACEQSRGFQVIILSKAPQRIAPQLKNSRLGNIFASCPLK